ncbi:hypothetical protein [Aliiglaciecola litoralis]|uniref:Solute-binding protein family 3/N-terminal domain-containing protein n=1 Tax=Aliiglaciecola litoralis TaxID=582857 RepID=A0ABN1LP32_9ALTE
MLKIRQSTFVFLTCIYLSGLMVGKAAHADTFVVGVEDLNFYPYFHFTSNERTFARALLDQFAKDNGHQIKYLTLPIKQFPHWLFKENIDFKFPDNERWQEINNIHHLKISYSDDVVGMTSGTLVLAKNSHNPITTIKSVGTITGFHPTLWLDKISKGEVALLEDPSPTILVQNLVKGLVDGLIIDLAVANNELKRLNLEEKIVYSQQIPQEIYAYKLSTVKHPHILQQFNQWQIQRRDFITALKSEFGILAIEPQKAQ